MNKYASQITDWLLLISIALLVVTIILKICKKDNAAKVVAYILGSIIIVAGVFGAIKIDNERKQTNLSVGSIKYTNTFSTNSFSYINNGLTFYHDTYDDTNTYYFNNELIPVTNFDGEKNNYLINLNNYILTDSEVKAGSIKAKFYLDFHDTEGDLLLSGCLTIELKFLSDKTEISFSTIGSESASYFSQYFSVNGINLKITESEKV